MRAAPFQAIPPLTLERYVAGASPPVWHPGDFILTRSDSLFGRLIRFGERLRFRGSDRRYTWCNHAALVIGENGELAEALARGVVRSRASKYQQKDYVVVRTGADRQDVAQILAFADWVLRTRARYDWTEIASLAITLLTGAKFTFFIDGEYICSGFVARAMERAGAIFSRDPVHVTPADLARYYGATPA